MFQEHGPDSCLDPSGELGLASGSHLEAATTGGTGKLLSTHLTPKVEVNMALLVCKCGS